MKKLHISEVLNESARPSTVRCNRVTQEFLGLTSLLENWARGATHCSRKNESISVKLELCSQWAILRFPLSKSSENPAMRFVAELCNRPPWPRTCQRETVASGAPPVHRYKKTAKICKKNMFKSFSNRSEVFCRRGEYGTCLMKQAAL